MNNILVAIFSLVLGISIGIGVGYYIGYNEGKQVNTLNIGDFHLQWKDQPK